MTDDSIKKMRSGRDFDSYAKIVGDFMVVCDNNKEGPEGTRHEYFPGFYTIRLADISLVFDPILHGCGDHSFDDCYSYYVTVQVGPRKLVFSDATARAFRNCYDGWRLSEEDKAKGLECLQRGTQDDL